MLAPEQVYDGSQWRVIGVSTAPPSTPGEGGLSALVTNTELSTWQDRAVSGPWRETGDVSTNSPGYWTRSDEWSMLTASTYDWSQDRWDGQTSGGASHRTSRRLADAALVALINDDEQLADDVFDELIAQRNMFETETGWVSEGGWNDGDGQPGGFPLAIRMGWWLDAYLTLTSMGYSSQSILDWHNAYAHVNKDELQSALNSPFPNRLSGDYSSRASWVDLGAEHDDGRDAWETSQGTVRGPRITRWYNNRRMTMAGHVGLAAAATGDETLRHHFETFCYELVAFGFRLDGLHGDYHRGSPGAAQTPVTYTWHGLELMVPAMEALARQGHTGSYDITTTDGSGGPGGTQDGTRTMEDLFHSAVQWVVGHSEERYFVGHFNDPLFRLWSLTDNGDVAIWDSTILYASNYFNRPDWRDIIYRSNVPTELEWTPGFRVNSSLRQTQTDHRMRFRFVDHNPYGEST